MGAFQILLEEFGSVAYADVTTRFKTSNSLNLLHFRDGRNFLMWDMPVFTSVVAYTNKLTFQYLNETRCVFKESSMIDSQVSGRILTQGTAAHVHTSSYIITMPGIFCYYKNWV